MSAAERLDPELVQYRELRDTDAPFVFSSWMRWARQLSPCLRHLPNRVFWSDRHGYRAHVEALLAKSRVLVACDPEQPEVIFGYAVGDPATRTLHFVYVDRPMRRRAGGTLPVGIGMSLVEALLGVTLRRDALTVTIDRPAMSVWAQRYRLRFDPMAVPLVGEWFKAWARDAWRAGTERT